MANIYDIPVHRITGEGASLADHRGKVLLVVNVASQCGLTKQYDALEKLYTRFKDSGFVICGFPANDFGAQEPGSNEEIQAFCTANYSVDFPLSPRSPSPAPTPTPSTKPSSPHSPKPSAQPANPSASASTASSRRSTTELPPTPSPGSSGTSKSSSSIATAKWSPASPPKSSPTTHPSSRPSNPRSTPSLGNQVAACI